MRKSLFLMFSLFYSIVFIENSNAVIETSSSRTIRENSLKVEELQKQVDVLKLEIRRLKGEDVKIRQSIDEKQDKVKEEENDDNENIDRAKTKEGIISVIPNDTRNKISSVFHKYFSPEINPVFLEKKHMVGITYGYDIDRRWAVLNEIGRKDTREMHTISVGYSSGFKFFCFNGRYTLGLFSWLGYDPKAVSGNFKYRTLGIEFIPEIIIGRKELYITAGVGASYVFYGKTSYDSTNRMNNTIHNSGDGVRKDGLTYFNWVITASIGHRFDNGFAIELLWKHYSNGQLGDVNYDLNFIGMSMKYAFTMYAG